MWYKLIEHINCKEQLEEIYDDITEGIKVKSKCQWYEEGKNSTKFFLNLEKTKATQGTVKKLEKNNKEIDNPVEINKKLERFFENLFKRKLRKMKHAYNEFLGDILLPTLSLEKKKFVTKKFANKTWFLLWKFFCNNKSPGNNAPAELFGENWNNHSWIR